MDTHTPEHAQYLTLLDRRGELRDQLNDYERSDPAYAATKAELKAAELGIAKIEADRERDMAYVNELKYGKPPRPRPQCEHAWHHYGTVNGKSDYGCQLCGATRT